MGTCNKESQINENQLGDEVIVMRRELGAARDALHAAREECASGECGVPASGVLPHLLCVGQGLWAVAFRLCPVANSQCRYRTLLSYVFPRFYLVKVYSRSVKGLS